MRRPCIFISAVSSELASARRETARVLHALGYDTISEEDFRTGHGELKAWLTGQIDACEGVIQLVGEAYGAEPPLSDDPKRPWPDPRLGRCSYTQYELLYAWRHRKHTWVILIEPEYPRDSPFEQLDLPRPGTDIGEAPDPAAHQAERRALERADIERLKSDNHLRHSAGSNTELENLLLRLKDELEELRAGERRSQRRLGWAIATVLAGLLVLGGGGWLVSQTLIERTDELATVTTERIRAQLLKAVEDTHRRDLDQAKQAEDWEERERRHEAAEAQRDAQLTRIDDLAASFAEIERQGEATSVFKELTRILQEPGGGVTQALAYIETKRPDILDDVDHIAQSAQTRIRAHLQPMLTSAGLYQAEGDAEAARGFYSQILTRAPDWPVALDENLRFLIEQGDLAMIRGNLSDARRDYADAQARAEHLFELEPANPERRRNYAASQGRVGDVEFALGHSEAALAAYQRYQDKMARLAADEPSNTELQRDLSVSLNKFGDVKAAQGDLAGAVDKYEKGRAIAERLAHDDPSNAVWQRDLSVSLNKIGDVKAIRRDYAGARGAYRASRAIFERLAEADPSNADVQRDLALSLQRVGDVKAAARDLVGALTTYQESQALILRLADADPSNAGWQRDLSVSLNKIGDVKFAAGDLDGALDAYEKTKGISESLTDAEHDNPNWQRDLSVSLEKVGDTKAAAGDLAGALEAYDESAVIAGRLADANPSNAGWQRDLSVIQQKRADITAVQGDLTEALQLYQKSKAIRERLAALASSDPERQRDLSVILERIGDIQVAQDDLARALDTYAESKAIAKRLVADYPDNLGWQRDLSVSLNRVGDVKVAQGDLTGALDAYGEGKVIAQRLADADPSNAGWQRDLYVSLRKVAETAKFLERPQEAIGHLQRAYKVLQSMADRGLPLAPEDLTFLKEMRVKLWMLD